jgi:diguanylate cyclase (GGDEF)-like protein
MSMAILRGSNMLKHAAEILKRSIRGSDMVTRYGGDEFVIALIEISGSDGMLVAERIRCTIMENPYRLSKSGQKRILSASLGVAAWEPQYRPIGIKTLIEQADQ